MNQVCGRSRATAPSTAAGFILLTVIALLLVLVMLATAAATIAARVRNDQIREDAQWQGTIDAHSTQATLLYLLGTQRLTFGGLTVDDQMRLTAFEQTVQGSADHVLSNMPVGNELRLDNTLYAGLGHSKFALQADSGRLSVNWSNPVVLQNWLLSLKVPVDKQAPLFAKLMDYQDADNLTRLNGAEDDQYRAAGLPPPPNRPLATPLELRKVMDWDKALSSLDNVQLLDITTVRRSAQISVNTAPASLLALLPGVTRQMADRVVALRQLQAIYLESTAYELLPTLPQESGLVSLHPGDSGTLAVWPLRGGDSVGGGVGWLLHWTLTPYDDGGQPWRIDYELPLPARARDGTTPLREAATPLLADPSAAHPPGAAAAA